MIARHYAPAAAAAAALGLFAVALLVGVDHDQASELLAKKAAPRGVKIYFDKGLSAHMGHKVFTQMYMDGLQATDVQEGNGPEAMPGDIVKVAYTGKLTNGKVFDKGTISFQLGKGKVIKGWDQGLVNMKQGGLRMLHIPPALAYGNKAVGNKIPEHSTLLFSVKLEHVTKKKGLGGLAAAHKKKPFFHKPAHKKGGPKNNLPWSTDGNNTASTSPTSSERFTQSDATFPTSSERFTQSDATFPTSSEHFTQSDATFPTSPERFTQRDATSLSPQLRGTRGVLRASLEMSAAVWCPVCVKRQ
eukprot:CAMPEP_0181322520 /NCGR_PEP_ID=MMETSP1101-20121128/19271_1 /TAXON_ID=46948 /ORGANISM="Rhodomonas abbreviata, Strain Caron Lab Isolate" /LENGTH=301 /DNA_ID=CAMNT_0023430437 /DNA_START=44 /DNA_END=950 /DNA_ORIENTATION=-